MVHRIDALDGIRLIGVFGVVLYHINELIPVADNLYIGTLGVFICLALSGFLYGYIHKPIEIEQPKKCIDVGYAKKKFVEFWPMHCIGFILAAGVEIFNRLIYHAPWTFQPITILKAIANLTLLQSWIPNSEFYFSFNGSSWFLSSIMFFYLFAPTISKIVYRTQNKNRCLLMIIPFVLVVILNKLPVSDEFMVWLAYINPIYVALMASLAVVVGARTRELFEVGGKIVSYEIIMIVVMILLARALKLVVLSCYLLFIIIIYFVSFSQKIAPAILGNKLIRWASSFSMEAYLIHQPVLVWTIAFAEFFHWKKGWTLYIAVLVSVVILAILSKSLMKKRKCKRYA